MSVSSATGAAPYDPGTANVYRPSIGSVLAMYFLLVFGVVLAIGSIWLPLSSDSPSMVDFYPWIVFFGLLMSTMCIYFYLALRGTRLVTSPWGIEYYGLGTEVRAPWRSVTGAEQVRSGYTWIDSLMVNEEAHRSGYMTKIMSGSADVWPVIRPLMIVIAILSGRAWMLGQDFDAAKIAQSIPVGSFDSNWRNSALGDDIRRYAPQVFGEAAGAKVAGREDEPPNTTASAAYPAAPAGPVTRRRAGGCLIPLALVVVEGLFAFLAGPAIYRSAQPLLGSSTALPGRQLATSVYGPSALSAGGRFLAADNQVMSLPDGAIKLKLLLPERPEGSSQALQSVALSPDGSLVAAGDDYGYAFVWQVADGHLMQTFSVTQQVPIYDSVLGASKIGYVYSVAFSPDGKRLAAVGPTGQIKVWNVGDGSLVSTMKSSQTAARLGASADLLFDPSGQVLYSLIEGTVETWGVQGGLPAGKSKIDVGDWVEAMSLTADGRTLALGTLYGGIYLWDATRLAMSRTIKEKKESGSSPEAMYGIAISPDGKTLVSGSSQGGMQVWPLDGGTPRSYRDPKSTTIRWMAFTADGSKLAYSKYDDNSVWLWDIKSALSATGTPVPR